MKKSRALCLALAALVLPSCGDSEKSKTSTPGAANGAPSTSSPTTTTGFKFSTGKFEVPEGDSFECFYTDTITEKTLNVNGAIGKQGKGGHHLLVYYADSKQPVGHHPCVDVEMLGLRQVAGTSGNKEGVIDLPPGYAAKIPAGKQLVVQAHYIRTEPGVQIEEDEVELQVLEDKDVKAYANSFVVLDMDFKLAARQSTKHTTECTVPKDVDVLLLVGHMHEWGKSFKLEQVDDKGKTISTIYETPEWDPLYTSHPPINRYDPQKPLKLTKGMRLRQTCSWDNNEEHEMTFPREMCVTFSYYIPDDGFVECNGKEVKE